ncbi:PREDICTED: uncharacterized protein LOC109346932 [Lupinus angustifolius]|uniref:uncharacterized protein LOC109346932 n=1 Tax=Lupinus angustifolius TaxID=3871 RepID=UPI00092E7C84|nr:PREDICTED: uncharacterized protein LOC109346932 [Lupinus angustifolius]
METKMESVRKISSPYDLSSSDNPRSVITQVQLRGENYEEWARAMRTSLRARRKWGFIDGTIGKPEEESSEMEDWWTVQSMLVSWILNTVEPNLRSTISYMENARDLWDDIKERFSVVNGPRIQQLKSELAGCKQGAVSMVTYYGKMKSLWDELANYEQIHICTCRGCTCDIASKLEKRQEEERVHQFLMGLDDVIYGTVRSNLLAADPLPSLNMVYSTLIQEERMKTITRAKEERGDIVGFAVQIGAKSREREDTKDKGDVCSHCNRSGHDTRNCFQLIGYPEWWADRPRNEGRSSGRGKGQQRTGTGMGRGRGGTMRANAAQVISTGGGVAGAACVDAEKSGLTGLDDEQWQTLIEMLNTRKQSISERMTGKQTYNSWIIDMGASNHMIGNLKGLCELRDVPGCPIGLPDGQHVTATKEGKIILDGDLKLENDRTSRMLIGAGERRDGLYYFQGMSRVKAFKTKGEDQPCLL